MSPEIAKAEGTTAGLDIANWDLWRNRWALGLLGLPMGAVLLFFGLIAWRVPTLPVEISLHFDNQGIPNRAGSPHGLFFLPLIATLIWLVNTSVGIRLHLQRTNRMAAYLLWATTIGAQLILWVAALYLLSEAG